GAAAGPASPGAWVAEGRTGSRTCAQLSASADAGDPASELVYTLTAAPTHGTLKLNNVALAVNDTFTQDDINTGNVSYSHDGSDKIGRASCRDSDENCTAAAGALSMTC